jgi:hypothetical protein
MVWEGHALPRTSTGRFGAWVGRCDTEFLNRILTDAAHVAVVQSMVKLAVRISVIQQSPADDGDGGVLPNPAFQHHPGTARVRPEREFVANDSTAGVDVMRTLRIEVADVAVGGCGRTSISVTKRVEIRHKRNPLAGSRPSICAPVTCRSSRPSAPAPPVKCGRCRCRAG